MYILRKIYIYNGLRLQDDNFVLSAIFCAIEENNQEGLDKLLSMANIDVNQTNKHGEGAIHVAAGLGQLDILKMLAAKGGNLGMVDYRGDSAIYWAARQGHEEIIRYLLSQGVHLNQQNKVWFPNVFFSLLFYFILFEFRVGSPVSMAHANMDMLNLLNI